MLSGWQSRIICFFPIPFSMAFNAGRSCATKGAKYSFVVYEIIFTIIIPIQAPKKNLKERKKTWKWPHSTEVLQIPLQLRFSTHVLIGSEKKEKYRIYIFRWMNWGIQSTLAKISRYKSLYNTESCHKHPERAFLWLSRELTHILIDYEW